MGRDDNRRLGVLGLLLFGGLLVARAEDLSEPERALNRFGDPFVRLSDAVADCPEPRGPRLTAAEARVQAHHRAERGTSCWLRGECSEPNAYRYDAGIAADLRQAFAAAPGLLEGTSLWLTVQGRVVYLEGCVPDAARASAIEALARARPGVQQALALVRIGPQGALPYRPRS
jgi:hypothetical protein